ncbi:hypothetical protein [Nafulsella turpanensis]|nr:hypothetical protein [Nafulsella turpanensis]
MAVHIYKAAPHFQTGTFVYNNPASGKEMKMTIYDKLCLIAQGKK